MEEIKQTNEKHECNYNILIINSTDSGISVRVDCKCDDSSVREVINFFDSPFLSAEDNFKGWFQAVSSYLIQNDYRIKDYRK